MEFGKNDNDSKYIYFDSDDDFYKFCVVPEIKAKPFTLDNGETFYTMDFDLSNDYNMAIQNGNIFVKKINDKHHRPDKQPVQNIIKKHRDCFQVIYRINGCRIEYQMKWSYQ